jgi:hypothetical protein
MARKFMTAREVAAKFGLDDYEKLFKKLDASEAGRALGKLGFKSDSLVGDYDGFAKTTSKLDESITSARSKSAPTKLKDPVVWCADYGKTRTCAKFKHLEDFIRLRERMRNR